MNRPSRTLISLATVSLTLASASTALAHYLWIGVDAKAKPNGVANVYFEEAPRAGDGHYLDPFLKHGKVWLRTIGEPKPQELTTREVTEGENLRWMAADLSAAGPRAIDSYGKFGVYTYPNDTNVLLHYYAKYVDATSVGELHKLARAEQLDLDIVPRVDGDSVELQLVWNGKPAAGSTVIVRGPNKFNVRPATDADGKVTFKAEHAGTYLIRSSVDLNEPGTDGGREYALIRHQVTLNLRFPLSQ